MTQQGFEDYLFTVFDRKNGTAKSYVTAIRIIDKLFSQNDVFHLNGTSIACINDSERLKEIADFVRVQQSLFIKNKESFFDMIDAGQIGYPKKSFCSAAMGRLLKYHEYAVEEQKADALVADLKKGAAVSKVLAEHFDVDKEGRDVEVSTTARLGQSYFRKMVLANYGNRCCVSGLNVPQTLRASHIVGWAEDKRHRMDPENGLCLSATYDAAFDKHLISFDDNYCMIVSKEIKDYYTNCVAKEYFENYEGVQMLLPSRFLPSKKLLEKHRALMAV